MNIAYQRTLEETQTLTQYSDSLIHVYVKCSKLAKLDLVTKSDPICILFIQKDDIFVEIARTEVMWNDPNPQFVKFFQIMYIFEEQQPLLFKVFTVKSEGDPIEKFTLIGSAETDVQTLVTNQGSPQEFQLKNVQLNKEPGNIILTVEKPISNHQSLNLTCNVLEMKKLDLAKNSPFLSFSKPHESGTQIPVHRSEVIKNVSSCTFENISIPLSLLCNGDLDVPFTISLMILKNTLHHNSLVLQRFL